MGLGGEEAGVVFVNERMLICLYVQTPKHIGMARTISDTCPVHTR